MNIFKRFLKKFEKENTEAEVKCFSKYQMKEGAFDTIERGVQSVPLDRIVGSVGRYHDFDGKFRIKQHVPRDRFIRIKKAMLKGKPLPPVKLYQIKDEYYALDGNHRIAAAKELEHSEINAYIVEFIPSKKSMENILYQERAEFNKKFKLPYSIELTELRQYAYLEKQIILHKTFLEKNSGRELSLKDTAEDWYKTIYSPLVSIIKHGHLNYSFPERTLSDLYTYISHHQWEEGKQRKYGIGIDQLIPKDMEEFRKKMEKKKFNYPEMKRKITAFVLMTTTAKDEFKIMENLFSIDEITEIHGVNGDFDMIVKIEIERDILSSDAEVISLFVHDKIRLMNGVKTTRTLIPSFSKTKEKKL